ncbi:MAG: tungsten formylmethanofuran dehydrogenase [Bacteroidetes bacterium]|nr:tungsten formylmethanofuran dehydrogenase [Bacteroidota bacterium]
MAIGLDILVKAYRHMCVSLAMSETYDRNRTVCYYVHANARGHEAIQLAVGMQLTPADWVSPYYRDDAMLLSMGWAPFDLMLQLIAKGSDPFSGGRNYYSHTCSRREDRPKMLHQSSATGMQAIPATGIAQGLRYLEQQGLGNAADRPLVVCSLGDGSMTEGEVAEALQFAALKQLPIVFLVQDNDWGISVKGDEARTMNAYEYAAGFEGLARKSIDGADFQESWESVQEVFDWVRRHRKPALLHARVPLLGHHTSGVRKDMYRPDDDLAEHQSRDPLPRLEALLLEQGLTPEQLQEIRRETAALVEADFARAVEAPEPDPARVSDHVFAPAPYVTEQGERAPEDAGKAIMVDAALHAMDEILRSCPEALLYGQDVGRRLGGVFREAALLAQRHGDERVFNTAIQEAYLIGSTAGMSATGCKPFVEIQFADYIWPGVNQLVSELSKSCYLTNGLFPVSAVIRVPIGAYGSGGPYHSGSVESALLSIRGIKIAYPSNAADMKGLLKGAFHDPNPVIVLEHKGLYWSKVPGTQAAKCTEPGEDYIVPLGLARVALAADEALVSGGESIGIITYGMGVHWALNAAPAFEGRVEVLDLRSLHPLDEEAVLHQAKRHGKVFVLTEEQLENSFAESLAGRIAAKAFRYLDAPVATLGALNLPAVPLNSGLEKAMLPNVEKVSAVIEQLLAY